MTEYTLADEIADLRKRMAHASDILDATMIVYLDKCADAHVRPDWTLVEAMQQIAEFIRND
jgi:hypothetical protein